MVKRSGRGGRKTMKIFRRVYAPVYHTVEAARNAARFLFRGSEKVINAGLGTVQGVGSSVAKHADETVKNVFAKRKSRKNMRKTRKSNRKTRSTRRH